jgi:hypothetical protein
LKTDAADLSLDSLFRRASMNSQKVANWVQVSANIGILLGLALVFLQIRQNTDILKTQMLFEESHRTVEAEYVMIGENGAEAWAKAITAPNELTLTEQRVVEGYLWGALEQWRYTYTLSQQGLLEEQWKNRVNSEVSYFLGNPYGRAWWKNIGDGPQYSDEFRELVNTELAEAEPNSTLDYHTRIMKQLQANP